MFVWYSVQITQFVQKFGALYIWCDSVWPTASIDILKCVSYALLVVNGSETIKLKQVVTWQPTWWIYYIQILFIQHMFTIQSMFQIKCSSYSDRMRFGLTLCLITTHSLNVCKYLIIVLYRFADTQLSWCSGRGNRGRSIMEDGTWRACTVLSWSKQEMSCNSSLIFHLTTHPSQSNTIYIYHNVKRTAFS